MRTVINIITFIIAVISLAIAINSSMSIPKIGVVNLEQVWEAVKKKYPVMNEKIKEVEEKYKNEKERLEISQKEILKLIYDLSKEAQTGLTQTKEFKKRLRELEFKSRQLEKNIKDTQIQLQKETDNIKAMYQNVIIEAIRRVQLKKRYALLIKFDSLLFSKPPILNATEEVITEIR